MSGAPGQAPGSPDPDLPVARSDLPELVLAGFLVPPHVETERCARRGVRLARGL